MCIHIDWQRPKQNKLQAQVKSNLSEKKNRIKHQYKVQDQVLIIYCVGQHNNWRKKTSQKEESYTITKVDRRIRDYDARFTRQENNGQRYGYECNEERDFYPYWHPIIWKDSVLFTGDTSRCDYFQQQSENVKGRRYYKVDEEFFN